MLHRIFVGGKDFVTAIFGGFIIYHACFIVQASLEPMFVLDDTAGELGGKKGS
jgi:hypothetical protein